VQQLLWLEALLKIAGGAALLIVPKTTIRLLGLPRAETGFWPRLLGAILLGLAGAFYLEDRFPGSKGLALGGAVIVNLAAATAILFMLALGGGAPKPRGRLALWLLVTVLIGLSLLEIAHA
jgi:hypothetical protein